MKLLKLLLFQLMLLVCIPAYGQVTTGIIKGKVVDRITKQPVAGAIIATEGKTATGAASDTAGFFTITSLAEGTYFLHVNYAGYQEKTLSDVNVIAGKTNYFEIEIEEVSRTLKEVSVKSFKFENSVLTPISSYSFSREEISLNPGAQGDIFRAIGMLPGVSSSGGEYSAIAVRGQGVRDNVYMVDDIPVTELGHLEGNGSFNDPNGGRFSIFAPRVIDNAQFQGGGFSAEYGRRSASYLGLGIKEGNRESATIDGQLDLLGLTVNYDGPSRLIKNTNVFVSARYQDFRAVVSLVGLKDIGLPAYGDFVFKSVTELNKKNKLSFIGILAPESYEHNITHVKDDEKLNNLSIINVYRNKIILGANLRTLVSKNSYWKNVLYYTTLNSDFYSGTAYPITDSLGRLENKDKLPSESRRQTQNYTESKLGYRSIYTVHFKGSSQLLAGVDVDGLHLKNTRRLNRPDTNYVFDESSYRPDPTKYYAIVTPENFNASFDDMSVNVSAYVNYSFRLLKKMSVNAGARYDYNGFTEQHSVGPRLNGSYALTDKTTISFATGIYYQDPTYSDIADQPKDKKLKEEQTIQYLLGYKKYFTPDLKLTVEAWYKTFDDLVVRPIDGYAFHNNAGTGWANGIDVNVTKRLTKKIHGQIGYSYMQSKRDDHDGRGEYEFTFSQPHQLNFLVSYKSNKHWLLSTKFRYATGKPTDSYIIHEDVFASSTLRRYSQELTGKNNDRLPDFISLDVRANYQFKMGKANLTAFVDIVDVLNRQIANGQQFNAVTGKTYFDGLSIFPSFGLKFLF